ncbi:MAG: Hpt domain-containing protein, partial [Myxococcales bacterium]|nr:Hpt domain-containing protein [Myxococcales bacterium]
RVGAPLRALEDVPHALLRLASRQRARVVIDDASLEDAIADDPYVARGECRSLLVAPLVRKGDVVGLLLLENASMSGAFTEDRIKVVEILGTQAAISLDNAQLYDELEARVARRTAELAERNAAMRLVLDNVRQGFLTLDPDAQISPERSAIISRWFGDACQGDFREFLASRSAVLAEWFELGWDSLRDGFLPLEVSVAQLPQRLELDARVFQIEWHPIVEDDDPEQLLGMLVVITDITVDLAKAEGDRKSLEHVKIFRRMSRDPVGFAEFVEEADRLVDQIRREHDAPPDEQLAWRKRWLHTLKGNCSIFGVNSVASTCAEIEHELAETRAALQPEQIARLRQRWDEVLEFVRSVGGDRPRDIRIPRRELNALIERARGVAPELAEALARWTLEPVADRFARLAEQAKALALRLGKPELVVEIDAGELRLDPERHRELWSNMVHAVRNAIDHGVEDPEIRRARGKPPTGQLRLSATRTPDHLVIEIADDGGGVDWSALRETARVAGLPHETHAELVAAMCTDGITSRAIVTDISGRGVGMSALLQAVRSLGGAIEVESELARGSTIRVLLPV